MKEKFQKCRQSHDPKELKNQHTRKMSKFQRDRDKIKNIFQNHNISYASVNQFKM
jgi:hypothetical protein